MSGFGDVFICIVIFGGGFVLGRILGKNEETN